MTVLWDEQRKEVLMCTVKLMPDGQSWRGRSRQIGLSYYTRAVPVASRHVAKARSRAARYSLAERR